VSRARGLDEFGQPRTHQFWEAQYLHRTFGGAENTAQGWLIPPPSLDRFPQVSLKELTRREQLEAETELFGYAATAHPLELFADVAWAASRPVKELGRHIGQTVVACGLVVEQRTHHQITGEPMKFLTLADWTCTVETELFSITHKNYVLATLRFARGGDFPENRGLGICCRGQFFRGEVGGGTFIVSPRNHHSLFHE
jgi:DNA polymerase III alpha subunit